MNPADLAIMDATIERSLLLQRLTAGEKRKAVALLEQMKKELKARMYEDLTDFGKARVNKLLKDSTEVIDGYYKDMGKTVDVPGISAHEVEATAQTFSPIGLEAALPTASVMKALVSDASLFGAPLADWWQKQSDDLAFRYANSVRQGISQGETLQQIIIRVFGSERLGTPGIGFPAETLRRHASALVHDSIMTVAYDARMAVYKANEDISKGYRHLSTLDGNICLACVSRSGATWDLNYKPINGTSLPYARTPIHVNCRCLILPILKTYRELGVDIDDPKGTRASDLGQIPSDTTFDAFLKRHDKAYQDDLLGPGRAQLWRDGKLSLADLVSQNNRPLTLNQLKGLTSF